MEKLRVAFVDFWPEIKDENIFLPILKKYFDVEETTIKPDVVFHSVFGKPLTASNYNNCKKFLIIAENYRPYNFHHMYSISFDSHSETNYRLPLWQIFLILQPELKDVLFNRSNNVKTFERFASFTVSNPNNFFRNSFFEQLNSYKKVHSYGKYRTTDIELLNFSKGKYWRNAKYQFFLKHTHKFAITFENNSYPGYCTEKLMDGFLGGSIPIYWGDPKIHKDWNEKAFINSMKLGVNTLDIVKKLDNDPKMFEDMYNQPVFTEEQKKMHIENIEGFETWLIEKIKK